MSVPSRDRIMAAAFEAIASEGLAGVTMTGIAAAAGVTRQTLYNHFSDVDGIVVAALEHHAAAVASDLEGLLGVAPDAPARIEQVVRYSVAGAHHGHRLERLVSGLSVEAQAGIEQHVERYRSIVAGIVDEGIGAGDFDPQLDAQAAAFVVVAMLEAAGELVGRLGSPASASSMLAAMVLGCLRRR